MHAHDIHSYEVHTSKIHAHKTHTGKTHAHEVHTRQMHAHEMHTHEVISEEPEMKSVIKDELLKELEDIIKKSVTAARLIPEYTPDISYSRRYYPMGIYESPCP